MLQLDINGYTRQQVIDQLHSVNGNREVSFRYELLDAFDGLVGHLDSVKGTISFNAEAKIKRTAQFEITDNKLDLTNKRIKPYFRLRMSDNNWIEWGLGVFLLSTPKSNDTNVQMVEAYDKTQILLEDKLINRLFISAGTTYTNAIKSILTSANINTVRIDDLALTLAVGMEYEIGTPKIDIINELLLAINYSSLYFDDQGYAAAQVYIEDGQRIAEYEYRTDETSVINRGSQYILDTFNIPNVFIRVVSSPERATPLKATYINDSVTSALSTVNRNRNVVNYEVLKDIADQQTLDDYVKRVAISSSQINGELVIRTAIMPHHSFNDALFVVVDDLIADNFIEKEWHLRLSNGLEMTHVLRKAVIL